MQVLEANVKDMRYADDFGRVEARVSLVVKPDVGRPARELRILTNQPLQGVRPLEERLLDDAISLAQHLVHRPHKREMPLAA